MCAWTNWTNCSWFCNEDDPLIKTRSLEKKEEVSEDVDHLCNEEEERPCHTNCTGQVSDILVVLFASDGTDLKIQSRSCLALMRTQRSAPKVADFFRGELVKKSTQDHPAKTRSRRGLEKRSAIVYPVQVSNFLLSVRFETLCLTRSLRIWKLDRVRVH